MRCAGIAWGLLAFAPLAAAQTPPAAPKNLAPITVPQTAAPVAGLAAPPVAPAPAALPAALVNHLTMWETKHKTISSYYNTADRVNRNLLTRKETKSEGTIMCLKPNYAWVQMANTADKNRWEAYISEGRSLFAYDSGKKSVKEFRLPQGAAIEGNLLLEFMSGALSAKDVMGRFELRLAREEEYYTHIELKPKRGKDKEEFETMTLVLYTDKVKGLEYLPKIVVIRANNGEDEEQWTFSDKPKLNNPGLTAGSFKYQEPPPGWTKVPPQQVGGAQGLPRK